MKVGFVYFGSDSGLLKNQFYLSDIRALESLGYEVVYIRRHSELLLKKVDFYFVWWWSRALPTVLYARLMKKKVFITGTFNFSHDSSTATLDYSARPLFHRFIISAAVKLCTANLIVSKFELKQLSKYFKSNNFHYFPHSVPKAKSILSNKKIPSTILNIAWQADANLQRKGVFDLVEALYLLKTKYKLEFSCCLAGRHGDGSDKLNRLVRERQLQREVSVKSELTAGEISMLQSSSSIYVQPSYFEGFGLAAAEAVSNGCVPVLSDIKANRELFGDEFIFFKSGEVEKLARCLHELMNSEIKLKKLRIAAREKSASFESQQQKTDRLNAIILKTMF